MLGLLTVAVGQAAFLSLRAERRANAARSASFLLQSGFVQHVQGTQVEDRDDLRNWTLHAESVEVEIEDLIREATLYRLHHADDGMSVSWMLWDR